MTQRPLVYRPYPPLSDPDKVREDITRSLIHDGNDEAEDRRYSTSRGGSSGSRQSTARVRELKKRQAGADKDELCRMLEAQLHLAKTPQERAAILEHLTRAVYDHIKTWVVGGEGLDNRDGPERRAAANCLDAALKYSAVAAGLE